MLPTDTLGLDFSQAISSIKVFSWHRLSRVQEKWSHAQRRDWREICHEVIAKRIDGAVQYMIAEESNVDRITIGLGPSSAARTEAAIRAADAFNNDRLPKRRSHPLCDDSSD